MNVDPRSVMMDFGPTGWSGIEGRGWADLEAIRVRLEAGVDPNSGVYAFGSHDGKPLHLAAEWGTPESVAELTRRVDDVDAEFDDRTVAWNVRASGEVESLPPRAAYGRDVRPEDLIGELRRCAASERDR